MEIGIDVDGVLRKLFERLREVYLEYYPTHKVAHIEEWGDYNIAKYFPIGKKIYPFWFKWHADEIYLKAATYNGAIEFMRDLKQNGEFVIIVSQQPNKHIEFLTNKWLIDINKIPHDSIIFTNDKTSFRGSFILDDYTKNLEKILNAGTAIPVCMDRPWNKDWKGLRVYNYNDFLDIIRNHH